MPERITVPGVGPVTYDLRHDFATGTSQFTLTGRRQHGIVTLYPDLGFSMSPWVAPAPLRLDTGRVTVVFGAGPPTEPGLYAGSSEALNRTDRLVVNGQRLTGAVPITITDANRGTNTPITAADLHITINHHLDGRSPSYVTRDTANRTGRILAALVRVWTASPAQDLDRLRQAVALHHAISWLDHTADELADLASARSQLRLHEDRLIREHRTLAPLVRALLQHSTEPRTGDGPAPQH